MSAACRRLAATYSNRISLLGVPEPESIHPFVSGRGRRSERPFILLRAGFVELLGMTAVSPDLSPRPWNGGTLQAAEKPFNAVILSSFAVILSAAKNLALSVFKAVRDSSSPAGSSE
jgi:hypothetical protein